MRLLVICNTVYIMYKLRKELLRELVENGHEVILAADDLGSNLYTERFSELGIINKQIDLDHRGKNPINEVKALLSYKRLITDIRPDVILTYTIKPNIYASFISKLKGIPIIMNVTGIGTGITQQKIFNPLRAIYKIAVKNSTICYFQNESNLRELVSKSDVALRKYKIINGSGVNLKEFRLKDYSKNDTDKVNIAFIGRVMKEKGMDELISTINYFSNRSIATFHIIGPIIEKKYENISELPNVNYHGYVDNVNGLLPTMDCVVLPSYHEGMANALLEAAASGLPLIATSIPGCQEIIDNGKNGYLCEVASEKSLINAISKFLELSNEEVEEMGKYSRLKIENEYNRNDIVKEYLNKIDEVLKKWKKKNV